MIIYNPTDSDALTSSIKYKPRSCFLMTKLGKPIPPEVDNIRSSLLEICSKKQYEVIDANTQVTGKDFLLKIFKLIVATPISIGVIHKEIPAKTQFNIYYELGLAQALGKETIIIKCPESDIPSDFVRTEYITYDENFKDSFLKFLKSVDEQAEHYELIADQLEKNPVLAIDYLRRAYLITGNTDLRNKVQMILSDSGLYERAKNSVELLAANF
ncbi:TPA: hypothetical protein ACT9NA_002920, partial [Legionella pneumophila]|uniref:hypothetical protein n=1 Tax=Legionella pneumophila TaxID=446 RepID=UPI00077753E6|nr:hypothetical protein [Legionella pneumophila]